MEQANNPTNALFAKMCTKKTRLAVVLTVYTVLTLLNYIIFTIGGINLKSIGGTIIFLAVAYGVWLENDVAMIVFASTSVRSALCGVILILFSASGWLDTLLTIASAAMFWLLIKDYKDN